MLNVVGKSTGADVYLGPFDQEDALIARHYRNDPLIHVWCRQKGPIDLHQQIAWYDRQSKDPSIQMFSILNSRASANHEEYIDSFVGVCGLTDIDYHNRRAEFSLYIAPEFHRKGYARAALHKLFDFGFRDLNLNIIWGESFHGNPGIKLFEEIGMIKEGSRRDFYWKNGKYLDAHLYSIKSEEWTKHLIGPHQ